MRAHLALLVAVLTLSGVLQAQKPRERDLAFDPYRQSLKRIEDEADTKLTAFVLKPSYKGEKEVRVLLGSVDLGPSKCYFGREVR